MEKTASLEELIKREYRTMVCTMAFGEITVSELCKRVGVSRKSFYAYFESRDDVLARILYDDIGAPIEKIFPLFRNQNAPVSVPIMNTMVYQAILDHKEFYQRLVTQNQERIFVHAFQKCLMVSHAFTNDTLGGKKGEEFEYASRFLAAAQAAIIVQWIRSGMEVAPEQLSEWFGAWSAPAVQSVAWGEDPEGK